MEELKPNKEKGSLCITDGGHSQPSLGWRDKARSGVSRSQPWPGHAGETGATENTQHRSDSTRGARTGRTGGN